jgi:gamma-glutamyl hercynylcysteine S-oxide hydrolase
VASEPYDDDPGWQEVPDGHLVTATPSGVDMTRLGEP